MGRRSCPGCDRGVAELGSELINFSAVTALGRLHDRQAQGLLPNPLPKTNQDRIDAVRRLVSLRRKWGSAPIQTRLF